MSAIDAAIHALDVALARDPQNAELAAQRAELLARRGTEHEQVARALADIEARMARPGIGSSEAATLLAEYQRLERLLDEAQKRAQASTQPANVSERA